MHISEGVLSAPVILTGAALTLAGTGIGLKKLDVDKVPQTAILASVFFLASFIHVSIGPVSVHLVMSGLLGIMLGWAAFPAILIALVLQAILFQFGGLTGLGANTFNMAAPAVLCHYLFRSWVRGENNTLAAVGGFLAGGSAIILAGLLMGFSLFLSGESFLIVARAVVVAHLPVLVIEGLLTMVCVQFLRKVRPETLRAACA